MTVKSITSTVFAATAIAVSAIAPLFAQTVAEQTTIPGHINTRIQAGVDRGEVEAAFPLNDIVLTLKPSIEQQADLETFLAARRQGRR